MKANVNFNVVIGIILSLIVFSIVFSQTSIIVSKSNSDEVNSIRQCKLSALYLSKVDKNAFSGKNYASFNCKTRNINFDPEKDDVEELLSKELFLCWDIFGRGKLGSIFLDKKLNFVGFKPNVDFYVADKCFVCSIINLDNPVSFNGFLEYLKNNNPPNSEFSYYYVLYNNVKPEENRFIHNKEGFFSVFSPNGLKDYQGSLYVVYSEGESYRGVGVYTDDEFNTGKVCTGVLFGN